SHAIIILPNTDGIELLVCYEDEGVYVNTYGRITKDVVLQWGEMPTFRGLKFLCERNDKVFFASVRSGGASQVYFMTLGRTSLMSW
ncbi:hypothetical protein CRUP_038869, partial [Coryphaenoides rupestris]